MIIVGLFLFILFVVIAFLCGSIPFGLIITKSVAGLDVRDYGSGNIGATNVARVLGKKYAALTLLLDGLKGVLPLLLARLYYNDPSQIFYLSMVGVAAILGHVFSPWLNFKGGKGVATTLFVSLALSWEIGVAMIVFWVVCFKLTRISALSALTSMVFTTLFVYVIEPVLFPVYLFLTALLCYTHRENIKRLINKEELGFAGNDKTNDDTKPQN